MPDVLLPFQALSDPLPSQGNEFTPQFPPQSLDLPSITISRNLVEQDGVLHSNGLHMVSNPPVTCDRSLALVLTRWGAEGLCSQMVPVWWWALGLYSGCPLDIGSTRLLSGIGWLTAIDDGQEESSHMKWTLGRLLTALKLAGLLLPLFQWRRELVVRVYSGKPLNVQACLTCPGFLNLS